MAPRKKEGSLLEVVLAVLVELGRSNVETDLDLAGVASLVDGLGEDLERLLGTLDVGSESSLVSDVGGIDSVLLLDDVLEGVVGLGTHLHGLVEVLGSGGEEHELLEGEGVTGVRSTVDDVHGGDGEDVRRLDTGELGEVDVERDTLHRENVRFHDDRFCDETELTFWPAAALATAIETPRMALAPSLPLLGVPSRSMRN